MAAEKKPRNAIDWESVEREYRTGIRSLRDIGAEFECAESAIRKKAKEKGWERDLSAKIAAKAEALVRKEEVRNQVRTEDIANERLIVEANAQVIANSVLHQRRDVSRARSIVNKLFEEVEAQCDDKEAFRHLGEIMAAPDESGKDRLNDLYHAAISLPERIKGAKALSDALKTLIELERKVLRIDAMSDDPVASAAKGAAEGASAGVGETTRSLLADLIGELGKDEAPAA